MAHRGPRKWNRGCIAQVLHGKCAGGGWTVRPTHCSTQLPPAHLVRPAQLNHPPRISRASPHLASRALCMGPRTLHGPANFVRARSLCVGLRTLQPVQFVAHALTSWPMQFATRSICYPRKSGPIQSKANTILQPEFNIRTPLYINHAKVLSVVKITIIITVTS